MQLAGRLALLVLGIAAGLGLAELAVRIGVVPDPVGDYLRVEGTTDDPRARILLLGDSFVDKRGEGFHGALLERLAPQRLAVVNLAVSGTGPAHYLGVLREHGRAVAPDFVVLFYFAGNDLINVIRYEPPRTDVRTLRDRLRPFIHRWHLYHALTARRGPPEFDFDAMLADGLDADLVERARSGEVNPWLLLIPEDVRGRYLATNLLIESDESRAGALELRRILGEIDSETRAIGAGLLIVVFPATTQVSRSHFDFYERAGYDPDPRTLTGNAPQRMIAEYASALGAPVLDLLPVFRAHADEALYRPYDSHLTARGNALAAEHVARFLAQRVPPVERR
jgi:hypothetical protein